MSPPASGGAHETTVAALPSVADASPSRKPDSTGLASGSTIKVQLLEVLDSDAPPTMQFTVAKIPDDVMGTDGRLAFPAGSHALIVIRQAGRQKDVSTLALALYSITAGGRQVRFVDGNRDLATASYSENAQQGASHRTVHLMEDTLIPFHLQAPVSLK